LRNTETNKADDDDDNDNDDHNEDDTQGATFDPAMVVKSLTVNPTMAN